MCFGPASPDAGVELLRQLFLQYNHKVSNTPSARTKAKTIFYPLSMDANLPFKGTLSPVLKC